ncbi:MAG TPA: tripartite tricarboxylate transporter TctB family protein [bacterium]|jgi:hypothetical protein
MRLRGQVIFSGAVMLVALWALYATKDWSIKTALYPRVIGVPFLILAATEFVLSLRGPDPEGTGRAMDVSFDVTVPPPVAMRRTLTTIGWLLAFFAGIYLVGLPWAVPLFVFLYVKGQGRESWLLSLALAAVAWLGFYALFIRLLHLPFAEGWLLQLLR